MNKGKNIYLLPLFLENMAFSLGNSDNILCDKMTTRISDELIEAHSKILSKLDHVSTKKMSNKKIIRDLYEQHKKVASESGGRQITVLFLLRELLIDLEHWHFLSKSDLSLLRKIVELENLFSDEYPTGVESRTIGRLLSIDNKNLQVNDRKVQLLFEIFEEQLRDKTTRKIYFDRSFFDAAKVQSVFFTYMGKDVQFENRNIMISTILNLKNIPFTNFLQELENICNRLNFIHQGKVLLPDKKVDGSIDKDKKEASFDTQLEESRLYVDFHTAAINFLRKEMSIKILKLDEMNVPNDLFPIIDDAWYVFSKMCREDIAKGTSLKSLPFQEFVIHSLHNHEKYHLQLCNSFKKCQQEDLL